MKDKTYVGRMPKFESAEALSDRIDAYFEACRGEIMKDPATDGPMLDRQGKPVTTGERPPTLSGLALALGFSCREGLMRYKGRAQYRELLLRARARLEQYAEEQLFSKGLSTGARYALEHALRPLAAQDGASALAPGYEDIMAQVRLQMAEDEDA